MTERAVIGRGRDCEILDYGDGRVLRRALDGRSLAAEAEVMAYARDHGFPVPVVHGEADGGIVLERLEGPTMLEAMVRAPRLRRWATQLAALHRRLHEIPAPPGLRAATPTGSRLLHLDLHPLNVMLTSDGPRVIDWSNAAAGEPGMDVALAWVILATSDIPEPQPLRSVAGVLRRRFVRHFLDAAGRDEAVRLLRAAADFRLRDPYQSAAERTRVQALATRVTSSTVET